MGGPEEPAPVETDRSERHIVILLPGGEPDQGKVEDLAKLAGLSPYDARLSLLTRRPRVFRKFPGADEARQFSRALAASGIAHYALAEASVLSLPVSKVTRIELHERHVALVLGRAPLSIPYDDLLLIVRGEIERERYREKRVGSTRGVSRRLTPGLRLHVYAREPSVAAEIVPEDFDWDALGESRTASALVNLQRLSSRLLQRAPAVELDRGFDDEPVVLSRGGSEQDVTSALAATEKGAAGVLYDNLSQFRYYARWRYRLARHLASRSSTTA